MGSSQHCTRINTRLLPVKFHYFLFMAALACALPFRSIFAKQLGISATAIGVMFCVVPFLKAVTNPLFGFVVDYFKQFRVTLSVIITVVALSHVIMVFIPSKVPMSHNTTDITEEDFRSKIRYDCANEAYSNDCDPSLVMYSEYVMTNISENKRNSFTCDILCSDLIIDNQNKENMLQCYDKVSFDVKVSADISSCDISVTLDSENIVFIGEGIQIPITVDVKERLGYKSWRDPAGNCTENAVTHSGSPSVKNRENMLNERSTFEKKYVSPALNIKGYEANAMPSWADVKKYYAEHRYRIKILNNQTQIHSSCRSDFICQTKKCYSKVDLKKSTDHASEFLSIQFWGLFFLIALSGVMLSAVIFLMDAVCYELLQENKEGYGKQRLWGTIGWGVGALAGGYLNQVATAGSDQVDYAPSFYLLAVLSLLDLIPMYKLKVTDFKYSPHIWKDVCFLFTKTSIIHNILVVYSVGALSGFIWNYQFWFMEEIGSSQVLLGLSQALECVFELPWFLVSGWIIQRIGHNHCNNVTFLCFGLRYLCFAVMYDPWWTLAAALLQGPSFGLFYASMTMYAKNEAPPGTEATVQSILHFFFEGIGVATGSFLGGVGLDKLGTRVSFTYAAIISFSLLFLNVFTAILLTRDKRNCRQMPDTIPRP